MIEETLAPTINLVFRLQRTTDSVGHETHTSLSPIVLSTSSSQKPYRSKTVCFHTPRISQNKHLTSFFTLYPPPPKSSQQLGHKISNTKSKKGQSVKKNSKMCRGFQQDERERLKIKAFYVHLAMKGSLSADSLTLHYLPRINGSSLEINGSTIRPDTPGFVTLHRAVSAEKASSKGVVYGSRERVKASEGLRFEIYMGYAKVLKGIFRKDDEEGQDWKVECASGDDVEGKAEVCVALEGRVGVISDKVEMVVRKRRRCLKLEEIPEENESERRCCCCECRGVVETGGLDCEMEEEEEEEEEEEMEGVRWAVDVGIWVVCLGVGYLVTKASSKSLRRRRLI